MNEANKVEIEFPHVVDNTMRKELVKCEMAAHYRHELGLQPSAAVKVDLHAGAAFAKGLEVARIAYYQQGKLSYVALQDGIKALYAAYGSFECPAKSNKSADRMAGALAFYLAQCPFENEPLKPLVLGSDKQLAVEVQFKVKLPIAHPVTFNDLFYVGRFDMLAQDANGDIWVVDEKTTSQMSDKWANQWLLDSQITGYVWGAMHMLRGLGYPGLADRVKGAVINGIAIRLRDYEHVRLPLYRQEWEIERWHNQLMRDIQQWKRAFMTQQHNQVLDHACAFYNNPCDFAPLCSSRNPERIIDGSYVVKRWNPETRKD
jgi:hypothetical protein